jgi:hypothetical protein
MALNICAVAAEPAGKAQFMRRLHHDVQILFVHPALEARLEIAVEHALAVVFENARVSEAAEQRLAHLAGIDAVLVGEAKASATASTPMPVTIWLAALATCPAPLAPTCTMFLPMHAKPAARAKPPRSRPP